MLEDGTEGENLRVGRKVVEVGGVTTDGGDGVEAEACLTENAEKC